MVTSPGNFAFGKYTEDTSFDVDAPISLALNVEIERVLDTTSDFKAMSLDKRRCLYPDERRLKFFPVYSEANCALECAWEATKELCQCVPWYLHRHFPDKDFCGFFGLSCFENLIANRYREIKTDCMSHCLRDCNSIEFKLIQPSTITLENQICSEEMTGLDTNDLLRLKCSWTTNFLNQSYQLVPKEMRCLSILTVILVVEQS